MIKMIRISLVPSPNMIHSGMPILMVVDVSHAALKARPSPVTLVSSGRVVALVVLAMALIQIQWWYDQSE